MEMTGWDWALLTLAVVDFVAVATLVWVGTSFLDTLKKAHHRAEPALTELRSLAAAGKAMTEQAKTDGTAIAGRVKDVAGRVEARVKKVRRIAGDLKPHAETTVAAVRQTGTSLAQKTRALEAVRRRLQRVKRAAEAAVDAARDA